MLDNINEFYVYLASLLIHFYISIENYLAIKVLVAHISIKKVMKEKKREKIELLISRHYIYYIYHF